MIEKGSFELIHFTSNTLVLRKVGIVENAIDTLPAPRLTWHDKVEKYRQNILKDSLWLENVRQKSIENGITIEEMITNDAVYLVEEEEKEYGL